MPDQPDRPDRPNPAQAVEARGPAAPDPGRRDLLGTLAAGCAGGAGLLAIWPLGAAALSTEPEAAPGDAPFLDVAAESDVREGVPLLVPLRTVARDGWVSAPRDLGAAWLLRTHGGLVALSASCPHLGCGIEQDPRGFLCPCHESRFDLLGNPRTGPSPRGLDPLPLRLERGRVLVQALRFATGGKTRRAL